MPRVPTQNDFQVTPRGLAPAQIVSPEVPDVVNQQNQRLGQEMLQTGGRLGQIAAGLQQEADQLRVTDALDKARNLALDMTYGDNGYSNLKGEAALDRKQPLEEEYTSEFQKRTGEIAQTLGNERQRAEFNARAQGMAFGLRQGAMQHRNQEFRTYSLSVSEGVQQTAIREVALNWNNPEAIDGAIERIRAETYRQANLKGLSGEWQEAQARNLTSAAHKEALAAALENNDPSYADAYLKRYSEQMDAGDILAVRGHITKEMDTMIGFRAAADALATVEPRINVNELERAFNVALNAESGGRQFDATGAPLTSPAGAIGIAQVMPDTAPEAAKLAGQPWDEKRYRNDPAYNKALGMAYFQKQLQANGGDLAKTYAAYNAGPGRLAEAEKAAEKDPTKTWLDFMPEETRNYVNKNLAAFEAGGGQPPKPAFAEVDRQLREDPRLANNPSRYKAAREDAKRQFDDMEKARKDLQDESAAEAMRGMVANGGRFFDLPVRQRAAVDPKDIPKMLEFGERVAKGDDQTDMLLYAALSSDPESLKKMTDPEFFRLRADLSQVDHKHFADIRAKLLNPEPGAGNDPGDLNSAAVKATLDNRLRMLELDPTPSLKGGTAQRQAEERIGAIRQAVDRQILLAQGVAKKKFNDRETAAEIDRFFALNAESIKKGIFGREKAGPSKPAVSMTVGDIPRAIRDDLIRRFKEKNIDNPTDGQILNAYLNAVADKR